MHIYLHRTYLCFHVSDLLLPLLLLMPYLIFLHLYSLQLQSQQHSISIHIKSGHPTNAHFNLSVDTQAFKDMTSHSIS